MIVGGGTYTYEVQEDWARLPEGWTMPAAAVTVDSHDRVYCFNRSPEHPVVVFDRDGSGRQELSRTEIEAEVEQRLGINGWASRQVLLFPV